MKSSTEFWRMGLGLGAAETAMVCQIFLVVELVGDVESASGAREMLWRMGRVA